MQPLHGRSRDSWLSIDGYSLLGFTTSPRFGGGKGRMSPVRVGLLCAGIPMRLPATNVRGKSRTETQELRPVEPQRGRRLDTHAHLGLAAFGCCIKFPNQADRVGDCLYYEFSENKARYAQSKTLCQAVIRPQ